MSIRPHVWAVLVAAAGAMWLVIWLLIWAVVALILTLPWG